MASGEFRRTFPLIITIEFVNKSVQPHAVVTGTGVRVDGDRLAILQPFGPDGVGMSLRLSNIAALTIVPEAQQN